MAVKDKLKTNIKINNVSMKQWTRFGLYLLLGFLLSIGKIAMGCAPFAVSAVAVSKKKGWIFSGIGAALGYLISGVNTYSARYLAAVVMAVIGAFAAETFELNLSASFGMAVAFLADFATGVVLNIHLGSEVEKYIVR